MSRQRFVGAFKRGLSRGGFFESFGQLSLGCLYFSFEEATRRRKPVLHLDLDQIDVTSAAARLRSWLAELRPHTLNVAGPRASKDPRIAAATHVVLEMALRAPVS